MPQKIGPKPKRPPQEGTIAWLLYQLVEKSPEKGKTKAIAEALGTSQKTINEWRKKGRVPTPKYHQLIPLARILSLPLDVLVRRLGAEEEALRGKKDLRKASREAAAVAEAPAADYGFYADILDRCDRMLEEVRHCAASAGAIGDRAAEIQTLVRADRERLRTG